MQISVRADTKQLTRHLRGIQRKQIPFATALALTRTAQDVQKAERKQTRKDLDRPTPFTQNAFYLKRANKRNLTAIVGIKDVQNKYLRMQIKGGTERPKNKAIPIPARALKLNKYGNMTRTKLKQMLSKPHLYKSMEINGIGGIWRIYKRAPPKLMVLYASKAKYKPRFKFYQTAEKTIKRVYRRRFNIALARALRTAR